LIGKYSLSGEGTDDFMMMLTSLKRNAYKIYPDLQHNKVLFCAAHRSLNLKLSIGVKKCFSFHKPQKILLFLFAMIDDDYFGTGVGLNEKTIIWISLLHNSYFNYNHHPMVVMPENLYFFGQPVTDYLPKFIKNLKNLWAVHLQHFSSLVAPMMHS
jgi:hypothetical protein